MNLQHSQLQNSWNSSSWSVLENFFTKLSEITNQLRSRDRAIRRYNIRKNANQQDHTKSARSYSTLLSKLQHESTNQFKTSVFKKFIGNSLSLWPQALWAHSDMPGTLLKCWCPNNPSLRPMHLLLSVHHAPMNWAYCKSPYLVFEVVCSWEHLWKLQES